MTTRHAAWLLPINAAAYLLGRCIGAVICRAHKP